MELYVHIPFCVKKCNYCDFLSFAGYGCDADTKHMDLCHRYIDALCLELEETAKKLGTDGKITSCFIGGGTPSVLDVVQTEQLLKSIAPFLKRAGAHDSAEDVEFTIECNPGTITEEKLLIYKKYGVNRLSIGLQSADNGILKKLGRIHTYEEFLVSFNLARNCGFDNINIDLISAVPGQTVDNWRNTLDKVVSLSPEHISAYSLILEEGTPLYHEFEKSPDSLNLPDEDTEREIYHITRSILRENGYERYEISNYAKPGYKCRHNIGYWTGKEYIGCGLGAASYFSEDSFISLERFSTDTETPQKSDTEKMFRIKNTSDMEKYIVSLLSEQNAGSRVPVKSLVSVSEGSQQDRNYAHVEEILDVNDRMSEFCILGLRMCEGISKHKFKQRFGCDIYEIFGNTIKKHIEDGLLEENEDRIRCTEKGLDLNNTVLCDFL